MYLALGFLLWKRDDKKDKADRRHRAPLILVPVNMERKSVRSGVKLTYHDDESKFNTTLLEMLHKDFEINITGLDSELPKDESGVDVAGKGVAHWLVERLSEGAPTLVGIDHGFSFPLRYFEAHGLEPDWQEFLDDFQRYWPTDEDHTYVDFIRDGLCGDGEARIGNSRWRRLPEERAGGAKSVFHFDVPGSVAKSTHTGIPWLRFIRYELGSLVHFWPSDSWEIPQGKPAVAEVYPAVWSRSFARENRTSDQHDAFYTTAWLSRADRDGSLAGFFDPSLTPPERTVAEVEGWILGLA